MAIAKLRAAVIGVGRVVPYAMVAPAAANPHVQIVAAASRSYKRAEAFARQYGIPAAYGNYLDLLKDTNIDLVYIATPTSTHAEIASAAIAVGKHVVVEKPFAMNAAEAGLILALAKTQGVFAFEAMHAPHHPLFRRVVTLLADGVLGRIDRAYARFTTVIEKSDGEFRWNPALGGGALMDLGIYPLTFCRRLFGDHFELESASAIYDNGVDSSFSARLRFENAVVVEISASMIEPTDASLTIEGKKGLLHVTNPVAPSLGNQLLLETDAGRTLETVTGASSWTYQLEAVCAALVKGAPFPVCAQEPLRSMQAIEKIRAAF